MNRKQFLKTMALAPLTAAAMKVNELTKIFESGKTEAQMPVLFLGHGSPMNAIEENQFVAGFRKLGNELERPDAILCISAHWETRGTFITAMQQPPTIHDFGGFPRELYEVQYPAPGHPVLASETKNMITKTEVGLDLNWGLDHGAWSVIKHLYPKADIPVIQMSIDFTQPAAYHYELAQQLKPLRRKKVLIVGSGNMVHNLRMVDWRRLNDNFAFDWAEEADTFMRRHILEGNHQPLINFTKQGRALDLAIPTPEHYLPLLYVLALQDKNEQVSLFNDKPVAGALTMTSVRIGSI